MAQRRISGYRRSVPVSAVGSEALPQHGLPLCQTCHLLGRGLQLCLRVMRDAPFSRLLSDQCGRSGRKTWKGGGRTRWTSWRGEPIAWLQSPAAPLPRCFSPCLRSPRPPGKASDGPLSSAQTPGEADRPPLPQLAVPWCLCSDRVPAAGLEGRIQAESVGRNKHLGEATEVLRGRRTRRGVGHW